MRGRKIFKKVRFVSVFINIPKFNIIFWVNKAVDTGYSQMDKHIEILNEKFQIHHHSECDSPYLFREIKKIDVTLRKLDT